MRERLLRSAVLDSVGVPHGFSVRAGGVSSGIFESLNFGNPSELARDERDPAANIRANFELVLGDLGCAGRETVEVHQVHGAGVHVVRAGRAAHATERDTKADAIVTDDAGRVLVIRVADCAPVLLADGTGALVAAVHAGWRGVVAGILPNTIERMRELGAQEVFAAVGPCIGVEHFEVGDEVVAEFRRVFPGVDSVVQRRAGEKARVDLKAALAEQLRIGGVERFDVLARCTYAERGLFFSHRRDAGRTGRMVGVIGARG